MGAMQVVKSLIQQGDFMMKLDAKDAYYVLPIHHSHKVSAVHLSGQNIRVSVPSLWSVLSSTGIHKDTEASAGSVVVHGYPRCDLHR